MIMKVTIHDGVMILIALWVEGLQKAVLPLQLKTQNARHTSHSLAISEMNPNTRTDGSIEPDSRHSEWQSAACAIDHDDNVTSMYPSDLKHTHILAYSVNGTS